MADENNREQQLYLTIMGDGIGERIAAGAIDISQQSCPVKRLNLLTKDDHQAMAAWRQPPGDGPFPAVVFIRGGLWSSDYDVLEYNLLNNPTFTRFLALGYACAEATFRDYQENVQDRGPILDCLAIVEAIRETPAVHAESVVLFGGSGGGSIALELARLIQLPAIVVCEPATIIFTGMLKTGDWQVINETMANPHKYYTPELQQQTQAKIKTISCPILILHSDIHKINTINNEIFIPELTAAGKSVECRLYPGKEHGFYFGYNADAETINAVVSDASRFIQEYLIVQPQHLALGARGTGRGDRSGL